MKRVIDPKILQARVKELFHYEEETGNFIRIKFVRGPSGAIGRVAGSFGHNGVVLIGIDGVYYSAHRLAWLYVTGELPEMIDHKDLNPSNNRFENLRACTNGQNQMNKRVMRNNKLRCKNIHMQRGRTYRATITKDKKTYNRTFKTLDDAQAWISQMRSELHGEFARS